MKIFFRNSDDKDLPRFSQSGSLTIFILIFAVFISAGVILLFLSTKKSDRHMENLELKQWSLGRFDFSLPDQFYPAGRNQSIYGVEVSTSRLQDQSPDTLWQIHLAKIKVDYSSSAHPELFIWIKEVKTGFNAVSYQKDPLVPAVTVDAQENFPDHILQLKCEGQLGRENELLRLITITAGGYKLGVPEGFNVGEGAITSESSVNEHAFASFKNDSLKIEVTIETQTPGKYLNDHPLSDISYEKKSLEKEGVGLKVLKDEKRTVAGFAGHEALIVIDTREDVPNFRYTWFYQGETANGFKPEILITMLGQEVNLETVKETWENLLKSLTIRK
jgi:hypothetical protein